MKLDLFFVVWGKDYLDLFLDVVIPSYLSKDNLPKLSQQHAASCFIYTNSEGAAYIKAHSAYQKLNLIVSVHLVPFLDTIDLLQGKYDKMSLCHEEAVKTALSRQTIAVLAMPDVIISNGSLWNAWQCIAAGKKVVIYPCFLRVVKETFAPAVRNRYFDPETETICLHHDEMYSFIDAHLHPYTQGQFLDSPTINEWASVQFIRIGTHYIIGKSFHFHPYVLDLRKVSLARSLAHIALDNGLIEALNFPPKSITVLEHSEEFSGLEISSVNWPFLIKHSKAPSCWRKLAHWLYWGVKNVEREHLLNFANYTFHYRSCKCCTTTSSMKIRIPFIISSLIYRMAHMLKTLHPRVLAKTCLVLLGKIFHVDFIGTIKKWLC